MSCSFSPVPLRSTRVCAITPLIYYSVVFYHGSYFPFSYQGLLKDVYVRSRCPYSSFQNKDRRQKLTPHISRDARPRPATPHMSRWDPSSSWTLPGAHPTALTATLPTPPRRAHAYPSLREEITSVTPPAPGPRCRGGVLSQCEPEMKVTLVSMFLARLPSIERGGLEIWGVKVLHARVGRRE